MGWERKQIPFTWVEDVAKEGLQMEAGNCLGMRKTRWKEAKGNFLGKCKFL